VPGPRSSGQRRSTRGRGKGGEHERGPPGRSRKGKDATAGWQGRSGSSSEVGSEGEDCIGTIRRLSRQREEVRVVKDQTRAAAVWRRKDRPRI